MGNLLTLCALGSSVSNQDKVLQVMKVNDGKILKFEAPIKVKDLLLNYPNCYVAIFREATQPLPLEYNLKIGKIYYLHPLFNAINTNIELTTMRDLVLSSSSSLPLPKPSNGAIRIKLILTKQQLRQLLSNHMRVEAMPLDIGKVRCNSSGLASAHVKKLEPIVEQNE